MLKWLPKLLIIFLVIAIAAAVGGCPCGLALMFTGTATSTASAQVTPPRCPSCPQAGTSSEKPDHRSPKTSMCASTVSGDLPASPSVAPAHVALPVMMQASVAALLLPARCEFWRGRSLELGLPPPPTLLSLSCSLTT